MPKGQTFTMIFDESDYWGKALCGFYIYMVDPLCKKSSYDFIARTALYVLKHKPSVENSTTHCFKPMLRGEGFMSKRCSTTNGVV